MLGALWDNVSIVLSIKEKVPMITNLVNTQAEQLEKQIAGMGQPLPKTRGGMMNMALERCRSFERAFSDKIDKEVCA